MSLKSVVHSIRRLAQRGFRMGPHDLRRTTPLYPAYGYHRGTPIDRLYIDHFLKTEAQHIRGDALEIAEDRYMTSFGGSAVTSATTFQLDQPGPGRLVGDLSKPDGLPEGQFDCFICTQTLNVIYDLPATIASCYRLLKPGGHLLLTVAGTTHLSRYDADRWGDHWRFTPQGLEKLTQTAFGNHVHIRSYGNVLAATAMLHGIVVEELSEAELLQNDPDYPVCICAIAERPA